MINLPNLYDPAIFCDSTVFSENLSSDDNSSLYLTSTDTMQATSQSEAPSQTTPLKNTTQNHALFPVLPTSHNLSALGNPLKFAAYIKSKLGIKQEPASLIIPMPPSDPSASRDTSTKVRRKEVNTTFLNILLDKPQLSVKSPPVWIKEAVFSDAILKKSSPSLEFNEENVCKLQQLWQGDKATGILASNPSTMSEAHVRLWLNLLINNLYAAHSLTFPTAGVTRTFDSSTSTLPPSGTYAPLKPDLVLVNHSHVHLAQQEVRIQWRNIFALVEITKKKRSPEQHVLSQIIKKASCIFDTQPQRAFVCALGIFLQGKNPVCPSYIFAVVDRAGVKSTNSSVIAGYHGLYFLRILFAFSLGSSALLGWDPSMEIDPTTNQVQRISVTNSSIPNSPETRWFTVVKLIHHSTTLFSRGTRVWIVSDENGGFYVLKDSWILESNVRSEIDMIKLIESMVKTEDGYLFQHSCPSYVIGQSCVQSTNVIRDTNLRSPGTRCRRRIVTDPIGDPITSFRSKKEFLTVCLDLVNVLEFLSKKANVVHGDLSVNNIMINRVWNYEPDKAPSELRSRALAGPYCAANPLLDPLANVLLDPDQFPIVDETGTLQYIESAGMIIDGDFMHLLGDSSQHASGTPPFMALEALATPSTSKFSHSAGHDLECLLNTILVICNYTSGPNGELRQPVMTIDAQMTMNKWFTIEDRTDLALWKSISLETFNEYMQKTLPEYWQDFAPFLLRLIRATWDGDVYVKSKNVATHQAYRDILVDALNTIQDNHNLSSYAQVHSPTHNPNALQVLDASILGKRQRNSKEPRNAGPAKAHRIESFVDPAESQPTPGDVANEPGAN